MRRHAIAIAVLLVAVVGVSSPAMAKGPSDAWISGPGLADEVHVGINTRPGILQFHETQPMSAPFGTVGQASWTPGDPTGDLGHRYVIVYAMGAVRGELDLVQHVYPFAAGGPVVFTPGGQPMWDNQVTKAGWFTASPELTGAFLDLGAPAEGTELAEEPEPRAPTWPRVLGIAALIGLLITGAAVVASRRGAGSR